MDKISNSRCRAYVQRHKPFKGSNLYATPIDKGTDNHRYVVYSYGEHFPLLIYTRGCWFENEDRPSRTTSRHRTQAHPLCPTVVLSTHWMRTLAVWGYEAIAKERILGRSQLQVTHYDADQYAEVTNG